ncbi:hypothetical protein V8F20_008078 [Naviculisporaceae sp. PSN 640]
MWSPLGDEPLNTSPSWRPEPEGRGHYGIISTCVITLSLCIWSALHLNVPEHKSSAFGQTMTKVKWLFVGLLAQEIIAFVAFRQRADQRDITAAMRKALGEQAPTKSDIGKRKQTWWERFLRYRPSKGQASESSVPDGPSTHQSDRTETEGISRDPPCCESTPPLRRNAWSTTHSFLALMGGFAIETSGSNEHLPLPQGRTRLVLTPKGLVRLAECRPHLIPDVSAEQIQDKSKTNHFAKSLMIVQALYFCIHFISRLAFRLSVTLLELNTFAHAVCALAIYFLWWDKPLDIQEPFVIPVNEGTTDPLYAAMLLQSSVGQTVRLAADTNLSHPPLMKRRLAKYVFSKFRVEAHVRPWPMYDGEFDIWPSRRESGTSHAEVTFPDQLFFSIKTSGTVHGLTVTVDSWADFLYDHMYVTVTKDTLMLRATAVSSSCGRRVLKVYRGRNDQPSWHGSSNWVVTHQKNWSSVVDQFIDFRWQFSAMTLVYGGWHLLAWNGPYPSYPQQILWRLSGIAVGTAFLWLAIAAQLETLLEGLSDDLRRRSTTQSPPHSKWQKIQSLLCRLGGRFFYACARINVVVLVLLLPLFVFARCYLVVGSVLALPYSPESAFKTPEWSLYFPHVS